MSTNFENMKYSFSAENVVYDEGVLYFVAREAKMLFSYEIGADEINLLGIVPEEDGLLERRFIGICKVKNKLVLIPYEAKKIWIFDVDSHKWENVDLSKFMSEDIDSRFSGSISYKNKVYMFGYSYNGLLCLDMQDCTIKHISSGGDELYSWGQSISIEGDKAYIARAKKNEIIEFDLNKEKISYIATNIQGQGLSSVAVENEQIYVLPVIGNVVYHGSKNTYIEKYKLPNEFLNNVYNGMINTDKFLYLYSASGLSYVINKTKNKESYTKNEKISCVKYIDEVGFVEISKGILRIYDENMNIKNQVKLQIDDDVFKQYFMECSLENHCLDENQMFDLNLFLDRIIKNC